ncbi:MAG: hypothetical protein J6Y40_06930 [Bacteroidales bacterium]|nr:hypothetical protein [Bacteroidales bacterium]
MKKYAIFSIIALAAAVMIYACKAKPAENVEQPKDAVTTLAPEHLVTLINGDWEAVPQELLDAVGMKTLKAFRQEVKDAQCDNLQYYYGKGATVELNEEGQPVAITSDDDNAVVIHLTAESVAYGTIAFRNEADYNEFLKKADAYKQTLTGEEDLAIEFTGDGKNTGEEKQMQGYENDKWYIVQFIADK